MRTLITLAFGTILATSAIAAPPPPPNVGSPPDKTAMKIAHLTQNIADTQAKMADPHTSANKEAKLAADLANEQAALASLTSP